MGLWYHATTLDEENDILSNPMTDSYFQYEWDLKLKIWHYMLKPIGFRESSMLNVKNYE